MNSDLAMCVDNFPWESSQQKEGFLNLVQYYRSFGKEPELPINLLATYFIQKDHESNEYWSELVSAQVSSLQSEIKFLQDKLMSALEIVDLLQTMVKNQTLLLETMAKSLPQH